MRRAGQPRPISGWRCLTTVMVVLVANRLPAFGQSVGGVVRDSATRLPVVGAVVSQIAASGLVTAQVITGGEGKFVLLMNDSINAVEIRRIGFYPRTVSASALRN